MAERKIADMHAWVEERLSAYIDEQLAPDERTRIDSHLAECARCHASLESLRWTVSLLKLAPAPAMPRSFTLPVPRTESKVGGSSFAFLRGATVLATLLLCLVVGLDLCSQSRFGFASAPSAPMPAAQFAAPTQNIALAPAATSAPTSVPAAAPIAPTTAPAATQAPRLSQPVALSTATRPPSVGAAEVQATRAQADDALKTLPTMTVPPPPFRSGITTTVPSPSPAPTQPLPTATRRSRLLRAQPTRD
jgi:anti-sigma factor RsiW